MSSNWPFQFVGEGDQIRLLAEEFDTVRAIHLREEAPESTREAAPTRLRDDRHRSGGVHGARDAAVVLDMATGRSRQAVIDDQGWAAELAIPFKTLNFDYESFRARI